MNSKKWIAAVIVILVGGAIFALGAAYFTKSEFDDGNIKESHLMPVKEITGEYDCTDESMSYRLSVNKDGEFSLKPSTGDGELSGSIGKWQERNALGSYKDLTGEGKLAVTIEKKESSKPWNLYNNDELLYSLDNGNLILKHNNKKLTFHRNYFRESVEYDAEPESTIVDGEGVTGYGYSDNGQEYEIEIIDEEPENLLKENWKYIEDINEDDTLFGFAEYRDTIDNKKNYSKTYIAYTITPDNKYVVVRADAEKEHEKEAERLVKKVVENIEVKSDGK